MYKRYISYGITDVGRIRIENEDFYIINKQKDLFILADGIGGHNAGEIASKLACSFFEKNFNKDDIQQNDLKKYLLDIFSKTNLKVHSESKVKDELQGMGTTLITCYLEGGFAHICHVGDVRAYLLNNEKLHKITEDHTPVANMMKNGLITEEEAKNHPFRNRINKAIGIQEEVIPAYNKIKINVHDILLLCSDGLWGMLNESDISDILMDTGTIMDKSNKLLNKANENGGNDNITLILIVFNNKIL